MFQRTISLVTLAALLINTVGLTGCTRIVKMPAGEINFEPSKKITRLKHGSGGYVRWNVNGAEYVYQAKLFDGVSDRGERQHVRLASVDSVYFVMGNDTTEQALDAKSFHRTFLKKRGDSIRGEIKGLVCDTGTIEFADNTAWIDTTNQTVNGVTKQGDTVSMPLNEIQILRIQRGSAGKTILLITGVSLLALLIAGVIASATMNVGLGTGGGGTW